MAAKGGIWTKKGFVKAVDRKDSGGGAEGSTAPQKETLQDRVLAAQKAKEDRMVGATESSEARRQAQIQERLGIGAQIKKENSDLADEFSINFEDLKDAGDTKEMLTISSYANSLAIGEKPTAKPKGRIKEIVDKFAETDDYVALMQVAKQGVGGVKSQFDRAARQRVADKGERDDRQRTTTNALALGSQLKKENSGLADEFNSSLLQLEKSRNVTQMVRTSNYANALANGMKPQNPPSGRMKEIVDAFHKSKDYPGLVQLSQGAIASVLRNLAGDSF